MLPFKLNHLYPLLGGQGSNINAKNWQVIKTVMVSRSKESLVTQDGYLDAAEVAHWILPGEVDHADNEAKHLIHETDTDKVGTASVEHLHINC